MPATRYLTAVFVLLAAACNGSIYVRDGVTDGDTFYLAERALVDSDPAYQSWVGYSLARSTCQLQVDTDNPARANSFACEMAAREVLLETWHAKRAANPAATDAYLDELALVQASGYLPGYVAFHFGKRQWQVPDDINVQQYRRWQDTTLPDHDPQTRLTGSWGYARNDTRN